MTRAGLLCAALAAAARASQPRAAEPVAAPMRDLAWGQLNFLHTTDTHGWLAGHLGEPQYSADWGDYVSLAHHMRARAHDRGADLLLVDTGDRVEGNGLYDASRPQGRYEAAIFAQQRVDIVTVGNHELYQAASADRERNTTLPNFPDSYVASNVDYIDPRTGRRGPLAPRFRRFKTAKLGLDIIAFGFLFDFTGNANNTVVQPVADAVKEPWFQQAMREKPDVFVVAGHVGLRMQEFRTVFSALRKQNWHIPILFFGGHAHVRDALSYDSLSFSLASGRYLETIGWMSVDGIKPKAPASASASLTFSRKYLDNNLLGMYYHTGLNQSTFATEQGTHTSAMIADARKALDLDRRLGCAPRDLWINRAPFPSNDSIYSWLQDSVLPAVAVNASRADKPRLVLINTGGIRFDILKGPFTRDSLFAVNPFHNRFKFVADVPYRVAQKVLGIINSGGPVLAAAAGSDARFLTIPQQMFPAPVPAAAAEPRLELRAVRPAGDDGSAPELTAGYTTKDDIGDDGDDTVHSPLTMHTVPNCIQAEAGLPAGEGAAPPPAVDVVFIDFLQPWMVPALKFAGGDYSDADVRPYTDDTLTDMMAAWIGDNWAAC